MKFYYEYRLNASDCNILLRMAGATNFIFSGVNLLLTVDDCPLWSLPPFWSSTSELIISKSSFPVDPLFICSLTQCLSESVGLLSFIGILVAGSDDGNVVWWQSIVNEPELNSSAPIKERKVSQNYILLFWSI